MIYHNVGSEITTILNNGIYHILKYGVFQPSRNGAVLRLDGPMITEHFNPLNRVLYSEARNANPFFHFMEALWMLGGRDDVKFLEQFNSNISKYSDDGIAFHGAYGKRWIEWNSYGFTMNQLTILIRDIKENPSSRRFVLSMYDPELDLAYYGKDVPCNTHIYFSMKRGKMDMTILNRSNDMIWGAYGANAVHFSYLFEYVCTMCQLEMGVMYQFSNDMHVYINHYPVSKLEEIMKNTILGSPYPQQSIPLISDIPSFDEELAMFLDETYTLTYKFNNNIFPQVAIPMFKAWKDLKSGGFGLNYILEMGQCDWKIACREFLERIHLNRRKAGVINEY